MNGRYEILGTTADVKLKVRGGTFAELLQNAALGMTAILQPEVDNRQSITRNLHVTATDQNSLLIDFLNELLYQIDVLRECYHQFQVTIEGHQATIKVEGHPLLRFAREVKAATYHNLAINQVNDHLEAEITFDI